MANQLTKPPRKGINRFENMEQHVQGMLIEMGLDPNEPGLKETPRRVTAYLLEYVNQFPDNIWTGVFDADGYSGIITLSNIPFRMICEHHLLPALGHAAIGYVPHKQILGLSKLPRLVDAVGTDVGADVRNRRHPGL